MSLLRRFVEIVTGGVAGDAVKAGEHLNAALVSLWELENANAPIGPDDCRRIAASIAKSIGAAREAALSGDRNSAVVHSPDGSNAPSSIQAAPPLPSAEELWRLWHAARGTPGPCVVDQDQAETDALSSLWLAGYHARKAGK